MKIYYINTHSLNLNPCYGLLLFKRPDSLLWPQALHGLTSTFFIQPYLVQLSSLLCSSLSSLLLVSWICISSSCHRSLALMASLYEYCSQSFSLKHLLSLLVSAYIFWRMYFLNSWMQSYFFFMYTHKSLYFPPQITLSLEQLFDDCFVPP